MPFFKNKFWILLIALCLVGCGGRLPSQMRSTQIIRSQLNKYAKKYKESNFGNKKVLNVEILTIEEIHKHLVAVHAFVTMTGPEVYKVRFNIEKGPFGWRFVSWENLGGS